VIEGFFNSLDIFVKIINHFIKKFSFATKIISRIPPINLLSFCGRCSKKQKLKYLLTCPHTRLGVI